MFKIKYKLQGLCVFLLSAYTQAETVYISAAASLAPSLTIIESLYKESHPNDELVINYASSSVLARQIQYGAPADIYISANKRWINYLSEQNRIEQKSITPFIDNQLVIAKTGNKNNSALSQNCFDQASTKVTFDKIYKQNKKIVVADLEHVPLGIYTKQTLNALGDVSDDQYQLIPSANARSALAFIEQGQTEYGFLYYSDAINSTKVNIICIIPSVFHDPIRYYIAKVAVNTSRKNSQSKHNFYTFLQSVAVKKILVEQGFLEQN